MSPISQLPGTIARREVLPKPSDADGLILEAWAQGYMVGSLIIMAFITMANMRRGILLHKLILLELVLGIWQGFWLFFRTPIYAWWLSIGAIFLNASWSLHNVISWMKIKPFLSRPVSWTFIGTVILVQPYWVAEIYANFAYFHGSNKVFEMTRPWEALCRDPWWIFTTLTLVWTIKTQYELTLAEIIRISPRFGIMLFAMIVSIIFIILDICSVTGAFDVAHPHPVGINPFWKLAFVFKCLTDMVVLDDFKTALDRLRAFKISRLGSFCQDNNDQRTWVDNNLNNTWEELAAGLQRDPLGEPLPSPDGALVNPISFPPWRPSSKHKLQKMEPNEHRDYVHAPESMHRDFGVGRDPEDIVPSALYGPSPSPTMRSPATAHCHQTRNGLSSDAGLRDSSSLQNDYARAMREVQSHGHGDFLDITSAGAASSSRQPS